MRFVCNTLKVQTLAKKKKTGFNPNNIKDFGSRYNYIIRINKQVTHWESLLPKNKQEIDIWNIQGIIKTLQDDDDRFVKYTDRHFIDRET